MDENRVNRLVNWITERYHDSSYAVDETIATLKIDRVPKIIRKGMTLEEFFTAIARVFGEIENDAVIRVNMEDRLWVSYNDEAESSKKSILNCMRHQAER